MLFRSFQQRVAQRVDYARGLLKQDIFDFSGDDRWYYDREDAPWAANDAEVEQLWKQSVRNDWLRLKLAGKDPDGIRKTLDKRYANLGKTLQQLDATDALGSYLRSEEHTSALQSIKRISYAVLCLKKKKTQ